MTSAIERKVGWKIIFPKSPDFVMYLHYAEIHQTQAQHDILVLSFKGSIERHSTKPVKSGDPVQFIWSTGINMDQEFVGFVHTVEKNVTANNTFTKIICINNSEVLKESGKKVYKPQSADSVVRSIAKSKGFYFDIESHSLINESIAQAGQSQWQLLRQLSNKTGYALRASNTTLMFKTKESIIKEKWRHAPVFRHYTLGPKALVGHQTLLSFTAQDAKKTPEYGSQGDLPLTLHNTSGQEYSFTPNWKTKSVSNQSVFKQTPPNWKSVYRNK